MKLVAASIAVLAVAVVVAALLLRPHHACRKNLFGGCVANTR